MKFNIDQDSHVSDLPDMSSSDLNVGVLMVRYRFGIIRAFGYSAVRL